ncbi:uncharacterized protein LOC135155220 [Lytechinus pictus]|uniref:uncharacterized protein LOC135155220 n=1 Tax=Lytechinus pictus TaxID=7653 RepID=UPI0030B9FA9C
MEDSFFQAVEWLDICGRNGITLNPKKFTFGADIVEFAGFEITPDSVRPCEKYLQAILDFPTPTRHHRRALLVWPCQSSILRLHCKNTEPFCCNTGWKITLVGSRFTHAAEARYAPVEGEALALADALDKARYFVLGCEDLTIAVDHKPLLKIFADRALQEIPNPRLRNLKEKTLRYRFRMVHIPGVRHRATDCLSRHPTGEPEKLHLPDDIATISLTPAMFLHSIPLMAGLRTMAPQEDTVGICTLSSAMCALESLHLKSVTWDRVRTATTSDDNMQALLNAVEAGMPEFRYELPSPLREYFPFRDDLYTSDGIFLYKGGSIGSSACCLCLLAWHHSSHYSSPCPVQPMQQDRTLQPTCTPTPLLSPDYPFQCICADFFHYKGCNYLVIVDRYSNWPIVERSNQGATGLISCLRRTFVTFGIPGELASDGCPEFTAAVTRRFLKDWGIYHRLSSVAYPHSNCRAEVAVKSVKRLIKSNTSPAGALDTDTFQRAMLHYRNTLDRDTKLSPAMCVFGHPIQDFISIVPCKYLPHNTWRETLAAREEALRTRHMRDAERWSEHTKRLLPLAVGDHVPSRIRQDHNHSSGTGLGL